MQNPETRSGAAPFVRRMTLEDIQDMVLRNMTIRVLLAVPTIDVQTAFNYLIATNYDVEKTCWRILDQQLEKGYKTLQLNELINLFTRSCVQTLQVMHPESSTQECYVAITIAKGVLDDAMKHLHWMQKQKQKRGSEGALAFLVFPDETVDAKPKW